MATLRLRIKKNYLLARENCEPNAIGTFLRSMGYNVASSTMKGSVHEDIEARGNEDPNVENLDVSNWQVQNENSVLEELNNIDVYGGRQIGKKVTPWLGKKCPSCKAGFVKKSSTKKCHGCDSFTHDRLSCVRFCSDKHQFYCTTCKSVAKENAANVEESNGQLSCSFCTFTTKRKYNLTRHLERKHENPVENITVVEIMNQPVQEHSKVVMNIQEQEITVKIGLSDILESLDMLDELNLFQRESIDFEILLDLTEEELDDMFRSIGMHAWGKRHKLKRALEDFKVGNCMSVKNKETDHEELINFENDECSLCQVATQHICRTCVKPVCILYCSVQDPSSDNESHRVHKPGDKRCQI